MRVIKRQLTVQCTFFSFFFLSQLIRVYYNQSTTICQDLGWYKMQQIRYNYLNKSHKRTNKNMCEAIKKYQ
jgi:hypothetical protein